MRVLCVAAVMLSGCATYRSALIESLDATGIAANTSGQLVIGYCDDLEQEVIDSPGGTYEEDRALIIDIRQKCDGLFRKYETLRNAHDLAVDTVTHGTEEQAVDAVHHVADLWVEIGRELEGR